MKTVCAIVAVVMCLALAAPAVAAPDYSRMSNDELYQAQQQGVPMEDRGKFEGVWTGRVATMTPEELKKYQVPYSSQEIQRMREGYRSPQQGGGPLGPSGR